MKSWKEEEEKEERKDGQVRGKEAAEERENGRKKERKRMERTGSPGYAQTIRKRNGDDNDDTKRKRYKQSYCIQGGGENHKSQIICV